MVNFDPQAILLNIKNRIHQAFEMRMHPRVRANSVQQVTQPESASQVDEANFEQVLNDFANVSVPLANSATNPAIEAAIAAASLQHGVDANLIRAVIRAESSYNPLAVSSAGAMGLMQLMPATARNLGVTNPFDINQNVNAGTAYLRNLLDRFDGNVELAVAAYNAGWPTVQQHGGIPPFAETEVFVPRVMGFKQEYVMAQYAQNADNRRR